MKQLNIVIPSIENEINILRRNLKELLMLLEVVKIKYIIHVIFQTRFNHNEIMDEFNSDFVKIYPVKFFSASRARNYGLSLISCEKNNYIYFLDCDALPSKCFLEMVKSAMTANLPISSGRVYWVSEDKDKDMQLCDLNDQKIITKKKIISIWRIRNKFLWTYVFRADLVRDIRFNERIGPGENTILKSGEDLFFYYEVIKVNKISRIFNYKEAIVFHPKRPADLSKELLYAEGQGALFRFLLFHMDLPFRLRITIVISFCLFVGNTFFRVVALKSSSIKIFKKRIKGFLYQYSEFDSGNQ